MKISEFSREFDVNKETIRYYTKCGLLIPPRAGSYYDYDERCVNDMKTILELKDFDFSIAEILKILSFMRISGVIKQEHRNVIIDIMSEKKGELHTQIAGLRDKLAKLEDYIERIRSYDVDDEETGIPLGFVKHMACPHCHAMLSIKNSLIKDMQIHSGSLSCECGYTATIQEGIIVCGNETGEENPAHKIADINDRLVRVEPDLISILQKCVNHIMTSYIPTNAEIVLDMNADYNLFTRHIISHLKGCRFYVITTCTLNSAKKIKNCIKKNSTDTDFIFITGDGEYPLKKESITLMFDIFASNFALFNYAHDIIPAALPYLQGDAHWVGTYFNYEDNAPSLQNLPPAHRNYLLKEFQLHRFKKFGFATLHSCEIGKQQKTGYALTFHNQKDTLHFWTFDCQRKKHL